MPADIMQILGQFGVAGLMGALWIWERRLSRRRESQLDQAHGELVRQRESTRALVEMVERNTLAIERLSQTQQQLNRLLERMHDAIHKTAA